MRCGDRELLWSYLGGDLSPEGRDAVEAHIGTCAHCQAQLEELRQIEQALAGEPILDPGAGFTIRVMAQIPETGQIWQFLWTIPLAACIVLTVWLRGPLGQDMTIAINGAVYWMQSHIGRSCFWIVAVANHMAEKYIEISKELSSLPLAVAFVFLACITLYLLEELYLNRT